ncbi:hypothetical protein B5X24_HaOG202515 [Helicoverpa armigera]|uniref:Uncharacterized protein n=1 Tax=Helicoverpa armigera TaxID=29058 RepID=A0A2W1BUY7_HELAM|nr:hypothetical protein B5X24_HaOG202515 [Helicoverpa armigera]
MDEPASSGDSGDESGSEPESPSEKLLQVHKQEWCDPNERDVKPRESHNDPLASTSSTTQEADSSKPSLPKLLPKLEMPGGAMLSSNTGRKYSAYLYTINNYYSVFNNIREISVLVSQLSRSFSLMDWQREL